jgi:glycosyltransferase involved in cell wall biosynthesis
MRIGIIAPPFIPVPPVKYGGTELFVANLGKGLRACGHDVTVYANGDSRVPCDLKWRYLNALWPIEDPAAAQLRNADHTAWAIHDAGASVDLVHLNDVAGVPLVRFLDVPVVLTVHHPHEPWLSDIYAKYPTIEYVAISAAQARFEVMPLMHVVHHGLPIEDYQFRAGKEDYVAFLGRMVPCKGPHLAIQAARRAGVRLKLAGEVQPVFRDYWEKEVLPHIDGRDIEYVGEADREMKNALLSRARALLFPILWDEPFGLVMVEAMACGTPVLALPGGSVAEIVRDGVSGWICSDVADMAAKCVSPGVPADSCRGWATQRFSCQRMVERYVEIYRHALMRTGTAETDRTVTAAGLVSGSGLGTSAGEASRT